MEQCALFIDSLCMKIFRVRRGDGYRSILCFGLCALICSIHLRDHVERGQDEEGTT